MMQQAQQAEINKATKAEAGRVSAANLVQRLRRFSCDEDLESG